jgi:RNA recognition motif-containing protein
MQLKEEQQQLISDIQEGKVKPTFEPPGGMNADLPYNMAEENPAFMASSTTTLSTQTNHTLYIKELRPYVTSAKLNKIFSEYKGFREVRHIPEKGVAFVEFDNDTQATHSLMQIQSFKFEDGHRLNASYARKQKFN